MKDGRLEQYNLGEVFQRASSANRLRATVLACERAVEDSKLPQAEEIVSQALMQVRAGTLPAPGLAGSLNAMAAAYDDPYLDLDEVAETSGDALKKADSQRFFRKARAAAALASALNEGLDNAIYEAAHATTGQDELLRSVEDALRG